MKRVCFFLVAVVLVVGLSGCHCCKPGCGVPCLSGCGGGGANMAAAAGPSGPGAGAVTYPYYTNRGPRDFLADDPPSIGP